MFPYRDNLISGKPPWGIYGIVAVLLIINIPLFLSEELHRTAITSFGFVPISFSTHSFINSYGLLTATFLHGDVFHLAGNCLVLIVFGRTLERLLGIHLILGLFPILGVAGFLLQWVIYPSSQLPVIGASGAVAALMGAYLPVFPRAKIRLIFFFGWFWKRFTVPAWVFLPYWICLQFFSITFGLNDGVAYAVHIGSFAAGALTVIFWKTTYPFAEEKLEQFVDKNFFVSRNI